MSQVSHTQQINRYFFYRVYRCVNLYLNSILSYFVHKPVLFVWIPKSAGSTIYSALQRDVRCANYKYIGTSSCFPNFGSATFGHKHYGQLLKQNIISADYHKKCLSFAVVRNPYDRVISLYNYFIDKKILNNITFESFVKSLPLGIEPIGDYNKKGLSMANPQSHWLYYEGQLIVKEILFFERDINLAMLTKYGIKSLGSENQSVKHASVDADLFGNPELVKIINDFYNADFENFGYKKH